MQTKPKALLFLFLATARMLVCMYAQLLSCVRQFVTPWTIACQTPLFMGFFRQEYWRGLPFPSPGHLHDPEIDPGSPALQADSLLSYQGSLDETLGILN